jgi:hypothetical protein
MKFPPFVVLVLVVALGACGSGPHAQEEKNTPWSEPYLNYAYLRRAWETSGRDWMHEYSGVKWNQDTQTWELDQQWASQGKEEGLWAYFIEHAAQGAVNMGFVCRDRILLNELAEFYLAYENRFTTLGELRRLKSRSYSTDSLDNQGPDSARTLAWIEETQERKYEVKEDVLSNSQFFHPAARLIWAITLLPEAERTPSMNDFVRSYTTLIVREHLIRFLYVAWAEYYDAQHLPTYPLVDIWQTIATTTIRPESSSQHAMFDIDLWLIVTSAEMLGANANNPALVALTAEERTLLLRAVQVGINLFQRKRTLYPNTQNFRGQVVGSASYFNGDFDDHDEMAYSGYTGEAFPTERDRRAAAGGTSWDIGHFSRVPIFLRSLYDNKRAAGVDFPTVRDVELLTNQLMYRVFRGDFNRPLFNNFFDGSNGWYQVNLESNTGYPPAQYCDSRSDTRFCLGTGGEWGVLASFNPDLMKLQHSLATLAWKEDPQTRAFKDRYYSDAGQSYAVRDAEGQTQYPMMLFWVLSATPEKLHGCPAPR